MLPLQDKRVLVTRARAQSAILKEKLEVQGAEVITIPTIEIAPPDSYDALDAALRCVAQYDCLVLTSANAVQAMSERAKQISVPLSDLAPLSIAAIGRKTADAITALGLPVALVPPRAIAESLAEELIPHILNKRVLLIRAKVARDVLPQTLTAAGAIVSVAEAYQTILPAGSIKALQQQFAGHFDVVTFTSASSAHNFHELMTSAQIEIPAALKKVSIGPITSSAIKEHGWQVAAEAEHANMDELVAAVILACS